MKAKKTGFTLIELLIVVAIIAILAAIAVPNFLEAQTRSKVSRAKADMRTLVTGLESYAVDYNKFPDVPRSVFPIKLGADYSRAALVKLSTPVAYLTQGHMDDPFAKIGSTSSVTGQSTDYFGYANAQASSYNPDLAAVMVPASLADTIGRFREHGFVLQSVGPDQLNYALTAEPDKGFPNAYMRLVNPTGPNGQNFIYDPTNGTISTGDIVKTVKLNFN